MAGADSGPDPIAAGAELVRVAPGATTELDHCFGCDGITISALVAGEGGVTVTFAAPALYPGSGGDPAPADEVGAHGFAAVTASAAPAPADPPRDASFEYTATCTSTDGGAPGTATGATTTLAVTGLTPGHAYSCVVTAADSGTTVASSAASDITLDGGAPAAENQAGAAPTPTSAASALAATGATGSATLARLAVGLIVLGLVLVAASCLRRAAASPTG
jgi:hypothetical protein